MYESTVQSPDLRRWVGLRAPLRLTPGIITAEEVESLYRVREERLYEDLNYTWDGFCTTCLRAARRTVDRAIGYLEEFGPPFFRVCQCMDVTPQDYRKLSRYLTRSGLMVDGKLFPLRPEDKDRLTLAAAGLLRRIRSGRGRSTASVSQALKRCTAAAHALRRLPAGLDRVDKLDLASAVCEIRKAVAEHGVLVAGW